MSKRDLKKYLEGLTHEQISEQFLEMYDKFADVKTYYDFVFNPKEEKLTGEAKAKILNEYFPVKTKRARLRRSVAQKFIKHFMVLGVDSHAIADTMLFNIETALKYTAKREIRYSSFYKSMAKSYEQTANYLDENKITRDFVGRMDIIADETRRQHWPNSEDFLRIVELL